MTVPKLQVCQCLFQNSITNLTEDRTVKVYNMKLIHESYANTNSADDEYTTDIGSHWKENLSIILERRTLFIDVFYSSFFFVHLCVH